MNTRRPIAAIMVGLAATLASPTAAPAATDTDGKGVIAVVYADQCDGTVKVGIPNVLAAAVNVKVNGEKHTIVASGVLSLVVAPESDGKVKVKIDEGPGQITADKATHTWQRPASCDKQSASPSSSAAASVSASAAASTSASGPAATVDGGTTPAPEQGDTRAAALALTGRNDGQIAAVGAALLLLGAGLIAFGRARFGRHRRSTLARR